MPEIIIDIGDMKYKHLISSVHRVVRVYGQNGDKSKQRQVKTATPKRRQKWLYSKRRQTQKTPRPTELLVKSI